MCVFAALLERIVMWWNFEIESKNKNEKKNFPFGDDDCSRVNSHRATLPSSLPSLPTVRVVCDARDGCSVTHDHSSSVLVAVVVVVVGFVARTSSNRDDA